MFQRRKRNSCIFFRQRRGGKIDSLFCLAVPQDAGPSCTPLQWHHRLTFFLFLFLPPPASYANCNRTPLSHTGDVLMLGSFLSGGLWAPGQHLLCVCRGVASAGPGLISGLAKRLPARPGEGAVPCVWPGLGRGVDMHRKLGADPWVLRAGVAGQEEAGRRRGRLSRGTVKSSAHSQSHLHTAWAGGQGPSGNPLGAVAAHSLSFLVFKLRSHGAGSVRLHREAVSLISTHDSETDRVLCNLRGLSKWR